MSRVYRALVELLRLAALLGLGLSLLGLGILVWVRVEILQRQAPGGDALDTFTGGARFNGASATFDARAFTPFG